MIDVRDYGAVGDGRTLDTEAINRAIEAAASSPWRRTSRLSPGRYLSGTVKLQSGVTLYLDAGAGARLIGGGAWDGHGLPRFARTLRRVIPCLSSTDRVFLAGEGVRPVDYRYKGHPAHEMRAVFNLGAYMPRVF